MNEIADDRGTVLISQRALEVLQMAAEAAVEMWREAPDMVGHLMPAELIGERAPTADEIEDGVPDDEMVRDVTPEFDGVLVLTAGVLGLSDRAARAAKAGQAMREDRLGASPDT